MTNQEQNDQDKAVKVRETRPESSQDWGRQMMGSVIGGAVGLLLAMGMRAMGWGAENVVPFILWGAVIGAMVSGIESLEAAGQRLTRRDTRWLNIAVAVLGMVIIFAIIFGLVSLLSVVLRQLSTL
jgi:predicted lipid-binding transport protein (Tim44 family)